MCKSKSGKLLWYNPETMVLYATYDQYGNYDPIMPLQPTEDIFERAISGFDF